MLDFIAPSYDLKTSNQVVFINHSFPNAVTFRNWLSNALGLPSEPWITWDGLYDYLSCSTNLEHKSYCLVHTVFPVKSVYDAAAYVGILAEEDNLILALFPKSLQQTVEWLLQVDRSGKNRPGIFVLNKPRLYLDRPGSIFQTQSNGQGKRYLQIIRKGRKGITICFFSKQYSLYGSPSLSSILKDSIDYYERVAALPPSCFYYGRPSFAGIRLLWNRFCRHARVNKQ